MQAAGSSQNEFIAYPKHRVVGTLADAQEARMAIEELLAAGFGRQEIDVLHGEEDLHRLDPTGSEHGFLARFHRTLIRTAGPAEEYKYLQQHVDDVRAGRFVIMVVAPERPKRDIAADILNSHGAEFLGFYGRWAYQSLGSSSDSSQASSPGSREAHTYEVAVEGVVTRVQAPSQVDATVTDPEPPAAFPASVTVIAPGVLLLSGQNADGAPIVYVADVTTGIVDALMPRSDGRLRHATGTLRRAD